MIATTDLAPEPDPQESDSASAARYDAELIKSFVAGNENAFNEIVVRYRRKLYTISFGLLRNSADAEEIAQDTLIRAHRSLHKFRGDSSLATWLHRITVNLSRNRYWYFFRRRRQDSLSLDHQIGEDPGMTFAGLIASDSPSPSHEMATNEFEDVITRCMRELPWGKREILELRMLEHRNYEYIAEALCINIGTVKSRIARSRATLLSIISRDYPDFVGDDLAKLLRRERAHGTIETA